MTRFVLPKFRKGTLVRLNDGTSGKVESATQRTNGYWYEVGGKFYAEFELTRA